jgi:hypothetical protein
MHKGLIFIVCLLLSCLSTVQAQQVTRGPYLQNANHEAITIKWRTDTLCDSRVRFGTNPGNLTQLVIDTVQTYNHTVRITGLAPYSQYFYAAGTTTMDLEGDDSSHHFHTNPIPGTAQPIKIWALGDFGRNNLAEYLVRDSYTKLAKADRPADVWLWLGDNAYDTGTDLEYTEKVFNVFDSLFDSQIFWPTPGNHDYGSVNQNGLPPTHTGPYYSIVEVPTNGEAGGVPSGGEMYYSFDYGNVHFISLNSELGPWINSDNTPLTQWLEADLQATTQPWKIVYFHQPPHTKGSHDSDNFWEVRMVAMRNNIMPIVERHGVDLVLSGHSHVYERSKLMYGFYEWSFLYSPSYEVDGGSGNESLGEEYHKSLSGQNPNRGTVYTVAGNGASSYAWGTLNHPMMVYGWGCDTCVGSMLIDVHEDTLRGKFYSAGGILKDEFSIFKDLTVAHDPLSEQNKSLKIWPNPFSDQLELEIELSENSRLFATILDISGQEVWNEKLGKFGIGKHQMVLKNLPTHLVSGTYILRIDNGIDSWTQRIVKQQ